MVGIRMSLWLTVLLLLFICFPLCRVCLWRGWPWLSSVCMSSSLKCFFTSRVLNCDVYYWLLRGIVVMHQHAAIRDAVQMLALHRHVVDAVSVGQLCHGGHGDRAM